MRVARQRSRARARRTCCSSCWPRNVCYGCVPSEVRAKRGGGPGGFPPAFPRRASAGGSGAQQATTIVALAGGVGGAAGVVSTFSAVASVHTRAQPQRSPRRRLTPPPLFSASPAPSFASRASRFGGRAGAGSDGLQRRGGGRRGARARASGVVVLVGACGPSLRPGREARGSGVGGEGPGVGASAKRGPARALTDCSGVEAGGGARERAPRAWSCLSAPVVRH